LAHGHRPGNAVPPPEFRSVLCRDGPVRVLILATPAYVQDGHPALLFILICGIGFVAIGAGWFRRLLRVRRQGYPWFDHILKEDS
jgi:hypothetical protein